MKYPTTWARQNDGSYSRSGQLEKNTRPVQIRIADGDSFGHYRPRRAIEIIEQAIASGHIRAERYRHCSGGRRKAEDAGGVKEFLRARRADPHQDDALRRFRSSTW